MPPHDRARLEQLCRYLVRPPLAHDRVQLRADGRVLVELKTVWCDGTSHLLFEPIESMEKLAAIISQNRRPAAQDAPPRPAPGELDADFSAARRGRS